MSTRSTNRDEVKNKDWTRRNPRKPKKERKWQGSSTLNTWREKDIALLRESQEKDSDLKAIIDLLNNQPYKMGTDSMIGYFL